MSKIPVVYIAGPYRGRTSDQVDKNIYAARHFGIEAIVVGWSPVIPHCNTQRLEVALPAVSDEFWLESTLELMRRCDAVLMVAGWESSVGATNERDKALRLGMPVFNSLAEMPSASDFLKSLNYYDKLTLPN